MTIHCSSCDMPLTGGLDTFGPMDFPLCWFCHSVFLGDDEQDFYDEHQRVQLIKHQYAGTCPYCHTVLEVGVGDWSVGRTCPACGYHDVTLLYPEIFP